MFEIASFETERRVNGTVAAGVGIALFAAMMLAMAPRILAEDLTQLLDAYPPAVREAFGLETLATLEGFLAAELYAFGIVLLFALYLAYAAASSVAGDVETGRMDMLLSNPVRRERVVVEKYLALVPTIIVVNLVVGATVWLGSVAIDDPIGLALSVLFTRESLAQRAALGLVFGLFMFESVTAAAELAWLGAVSPMAHYDPTAVLVHGEYDLVGAGLLLAMSIILVAGSAWHFGRRDVR